MLCFIERLKAFQDLKSEISDLKALAESISRLIRGWVDSLQNSDIKGQRYLNEKERRFAQDKKKREEFMTMLKNYQKPKD